MNDRLSRLFKRLNRDEKQVMAEIYELTSAHLYGIIFRILPNDILASNVLKSLYTQIWNDRHEKGFNTDDPLNALRARAHRAAIEYKLTHYVISSVKIDSPLPKSRQIDIIKSKLVSIDENSLRILSLAYLNAIPVDELAQRFEMTPEDISDRLSNLVSTLTGASS